VVGKIQIEFSKLERIKLGSAVDVIWKEPLIIAGGDTFINSMMDVLGLENIFRDLSCYPEVQREELRPADQILLTNDPYLFTEEEQLEFQEKIPPSRVIRVDGTVFTCVWQPNVICSCLFSRTAAQLKPILAMIRF